MQIDMYRSNDVVQFNSDSIFIRPFAKVGEKPENIKVIKYFLQQKKFNYEYDSDEEDEHGPEINQNLLLPKPKRKRRSKFGTLLKNVF